MTCVKEFLGWKKGKNRRKEEGRGGDWHVGVPAAKFTFLGSELFGACVFAKRNRIRSRGVVNVRKSSRGLEMRNAAAEAFFMCV